MDPDYDPLARRLEQAKALSAGSLAVLMVGFVLGIHLITGAALVALIIFAGRWIQLGSRLRERDAEEPGEDPPASNIIQFRSPHKKTDSAEEPQE
jgi:hypothetical protein